MAIFVQGKPIDVQSLVAATNLQQQSEVIPILEEVADQPEDADLSLGHGGAGKTVVCHFFNEEFLLPWWLKHHKNVFDHGIMIDYASTDRSCELIREICPTWEIRPSRNKFFESVAIDREVMDIERKLLGWRMALNVTEFLYGNTDHLVDNSAYSQYLIANYVFVDMGAESNPVELSYDRPLHQQRYWGYDEFANNGVYKGGQMGRMCRSVHNYPIVYAGGRHFGDDRPKSFSDLYIFYYGHASDSEQGIRRKTQIKDKVGDSEANSAHRHDAEYYKTGFTDLRNRSRDLASEIEPILEHNRRITGEDW